MPVVDKQKSTPPEVKAQYAWALRRRLLGRARQSLPSAWRADTATPVFWLEADCGLRAGGGANFSSPSLLSDSSTFLLIPNEKIQEGMAPRGIGFGIRLPSPN